MSAFAAPIDSLKLHPSVLLTRPHPMRTNTEEHLAFRRNICAEDWHLWQNFLCFSSACSFNQMACCFAYSGINLGASFCPQHPPQGFQCSGTYRCTSAPASSYFWLLLSLVFLIPSYWPLYPVPSTPPPNSLPDATFCCSIFSLTGDMKPLCSSCKRPCDECTDDRLLSVTASIHHKGAIVLYLFSWENCSELLTNALSYHFWLTGHYEQGMEAKLIIVRFCIYHNHDDVRL